MQGSQGSLWRELAKVVLPGLIAFFGAMLGVEIRSKTTERGRIVARNDDLELIVAEIRALKEVETKVSGGEWQRQWRLQKKLDCYSLLLERLEELKEHNNALKRSCTTSVQGGAVSAARYDLEQALIAFQHARSSARLVASESCLAAVHQVVLPVREILSSESDIDHCYESIRSIVRAARVELTHAARADLGFEFYNEPADRT